MFVYINSSLDREPRDNTSQFTTYFQRPIDIPSGSVGRLGVKSAEIPYTTTQFKLSNSVFWIEEATQQRASGTTDEWSVASHRAIGLPIDHTRFYLTVSEVMKALNDLTTANNVNVEFQYSNDEIDKRIKVFNKSNSTSDGTTDTRIAYRVISSLDYEQVYIGAVYIRSTKFGENTELFNQMNLKLGFFGDLRNAYIPPQQTGMAYGIPRLIRSNFFLLTADIVSKEGIFPQLRNNINVIAKVPITNSFGTLQTVYFDHPQFTQIGDNSIDKIEFGLVDDEYEDVDLYGASISLQLEVRIE